MSFGVIAVLYDPETGQIRQSIQTSQPALDHLGIPYVVVDEWQRDYNVTHKVVDGKIVLKEQQ